MLVLLEKYSFEVVLVALYLNQKGWSFGYLREKEYMHNITYIMLNIIHGMLLIIFNKLNIVLIMINV